MPDRFVVTNVRTFLCSADDADTAERFTREADEAGFAEPDTDEWFVALMFDDEEAT